VPVSANSSSYPYDTVVYITDEIGGVEYQGSGVLIAPNEVLTAAHVVYDSGVGTATDITVTPGYNAGSAPFGSATGLSFHYYAISDANGQISEAESQDDFAVIHLSTSFSSVGTMDLMPGFTGGLATVTGYPASAGGTQVSDTEFFSLDPTYSLLDGTGLGEGSSGGPVWTGSPADPQVVGLVSSGSGKLGYFSLITTAVSNQIQQWVADDNAGGNGSTSLAVGWTDTTTNASGTDQAGPYSGPNSQLKYQYTRITADNVNVSTPVPSIWITTGAGNDAIAATGGGDNVLDGGAGSNFLYGSSGADGGHDTFYTALSSSQTTWDNIVNFHSGDVLTIWNATSFNASDWVGVAGTTQYNGATLQIGGDRVTFSGISVAQAQQFSVQISQTQGVNGPVPFVALFFT
jgi:V8-like Glu-specific endopeptidase